MKSLLFFVVLILLCKNLQGQFSKKHQNTSYIALKIVSIEAKEKIQEGVQGVNLTIKLHTDSIFVPEEHHISNISLSVFFMDSLKKPLPPLDSTTKYREKFYAGFRLKENYSSSKTFSCFIPYYALNIKAGKQKIFFKIAGISVKEEHIDKKGKKQTKYIPVYIRGKRELAFEFEKPKTQKFRTCIGEVEFLPYDEKGSPWDYGFFSGEKEKPDISIAIKTYEYRYFFPEARDQFYTNYSGKCSPWIIVSVNDEVRVQALDIDRNLSYDVASSQSFHSKNVSELTFPLRLENTGQIRVWEILLAEFE